MLCNNKCYKLNLGAEKTAFGFQPESQSPSVTMNRRMQQTMVQHETAYTSIVLACACATEMRTVRIRMRV